MPENRKVKKWVDSRCCISSLSVSRTRLRPCPGCEKLWQRSNSVSTLESALRAAPIPDTAPPVDKTGLELKRGAFFNTIALLASNLRGVFTFLVARLLGPAALGTFSVAWANTDLVSKIA